MLAELVFIVVVTITPWLEPVWRWLCATYRPYPMFVIGCFASQIIGYFLGCLPYMCLDLVRTKKYKVQRDAAHPTNREFATTCGAMLWSFASVILPMLLVGGPFLSSVGISGDEALPSRAALATQIAYFFLVEDYLNYWLHRALHQPWLYKHIHSVHHTYDAPFAVVAAYAHPAEVVILAIPTFAGPALIGPHLYTLLVWQLMRNLEAIDIHSGYELPGGFGTVFPGYAGTAHHDYHHYMHSGNFASVFTWCDRLYGTHLGYQRFTKKKRKIM